jgi:hypothetical protein
MGEMSLARGLAAKVSIALRPNNISSKRSDAAA